MGAIEGVKRAVGKAWCGVLSADPSKVAGIGVSVGLGTGIANLGLSALQDYMSQVHLFNCGGNPSNIPDAAPTPPPPFEGGQCVGVNYRLRLCMQASWQGAPLECSNSGWIPGKILGYVVGSPDVAGNRSVSVDSSTAGLVPVWTLGQNYSVISFSVDARQDGQPDNCGNPEVSPSLPPPLPYVDTNEDVEYTDKDNNPVNLPNIPIRFFPPCINLDGLRIPFEVDLGFTKICGKIGLRTDLTNVVEPDIDIDLCPSQKSDLGYSEDDIKDYFELDDWIGGSSSEPLFNGSLSPSFSEEDVPIMGVFVNSRKSGNSQSNSILVKRTPDNFPTLLIPKIAYVQFAYLIKKESGFDYSYSEDIPVKMSQQFVPCPSSFGAVAVNVRWEKGWTGGYRIARRKSCCEACSQNDPNAGLDRLNRCRID